MPEIKKSLIIPDEIVLSKIYLIRGIKVMLDSDLAELYEIETKRLNEQVKRNKDRFPEDFMFQLNREEFENLKSHFATSSPMEIKQWGGKRKLPNAFTEHGVLMLSSVLNSDKAIQVNIQIMRIFTKVRQMFMENTELRLELEGIKKKVENQGKNIELVFNYLDELLEKKETPEKREEIGYKRKANKH